MCVCVCVLCSIFFWIYCFGRSQIWITTDVVDWITHTSTRIARWSSTYSCMRGSALTLCWMSEMKSKNTSKRCSVLSSWQWVGDWLSSHNRRYFMIAWNIRGPSWVFCVAVALHTRTQRSSCRSNILSHRQWVIMLTKWCAAWHAIITTTELTELLERCFFSLVVRA